MIIHISCPRPTGGDRCLPGKGFWQALSDGSPSLPAPRQRVGGSSSAVSEAILVTGTLLLAAFQRGTAGHQGRLLNVYTNCPQTAFADHPSDQGSVRPVFGEAGVVLVFRDISSAQCYLR